MNKPSITIIKKPSGEYKLLAVSDDADDALSAFKNCDEAGEVQLWIKSPHDKRKVNSSPPKAAKKAAKKSK